MLKKISNLGSTLNKTEQRSINGGRRDECTSAKDCYLATGGQSSLSDYICINGYCAFAFF